MPQIFDNIDLPLLPALQHTLEVADRADFCVGYFNLRGWKQLARFVDRWDGGDGRCCRLLVGMNRPADAELRDALTRGEDGDEIDNATVLRRKKELAEGFQKQLMLGAPNNEDEAGLRQLAAQLRARKVVVKLFLRHPLHAKLYLLFRPDRISPVVGYLGSSNLTMAGLSAQGELNVDVLDHDACNKLAAWFEDRWDDRWCIDISEELATIIDESWARDELIHPYLIYVKIAYHLSREARAGLAEFEIPADIDQRLFEFQRAAVKIAARHLTQRGGVLIGDVVGLGKTLMATALARVMQERDGVSTLIVCPKNLERMWTDHAERYGLHAKVVRFSRMVKELPNVPARFRQVLIDESHNLRNREGKRYAALKDYIGRSGSRCIMLSATPYNKDFLDLANQLRLFLPEGQNVGIRPERYLQDLGETEFVRRHQCDVRTLAAFEKSPYADDWRELMRLYLVRRTRSFIQENYAQTERGTGRKFLTFDDGTRSFFPTRVPRTVPFAIDDADPDDQYARLYADTVVDAINKLSLPRYGLANYVAPSPDDPPTPAEAAKLNDLSRAGKRLMGFCRTNLFKRLESSGFAFLQSVERHVLRNCVYLHAIDNGLPLPIGTQNAELLDPVADDDDDHDADVLFDAEDGGAPGNMPAASLRSEADFRARAADVYRDYEGSYHRRFKWLRPGLFVERLARDLRKDNKALLGVLKACGAWNPAHDTKLDALASLLTETHAGAKVLVFSQFADTVRYLDAQLRVRGVARIAAASGDTADPTALAYRFSPVSNGRRAEVPPERELNVLLATDVLSEGQNLQDCAVVVNFDLPWAIIRLIQRAGRVDRIGQTADRILCYSFLPAEGVERIIRLRSRVRQRLTENAEVVGTDEAFFEDDGGGRTVIDLYHEKAGILDGDADGEVDLASYAYQIWKNATTDDPALAKGIEAMPNVVYATKPHDATPEGPPGVLVYMKSAEGNDSLAWMARDGTSVTESQFAILKAAACTPDTTPLPRADNHHALVQKAVAKITAEEKAVGGQLGRPAGARFKTYEKLTRHAEALKDTLYESPALKKVIDEIYRYPLKPTATDMLNRLLRAGIDDAGLAERVLALREEDRLCQVSEEGVRRDAQIICSLGLAGPHTGT